MRRSLPGGHDTQYLLHFKSSNTITFRALIEVGGQVDYKRRELLPIEDSQPLPELMESLREYHRVTGRRVTLAWTLIADVNTRPEDARLLAELTRGLPIQVDLIDVNDPTGQFKPPTVAELDRFRDALRAELAVPVVRRYSGGQDINGGCGMLAGKVHLR